MCVWGGGTLTADLVTNGGGGEAPCTLTDLVRHPGLTPGATWCLCGDDTFRVYKHV